jgi:cullin 1
VLQDIFHKYYAKLLSKRIIQLTSASNDAEERMLANMRRTSGFEYTSKLQRMFVDKQLSRDLHTGYVEWQEVHYSSLVTVHVYRLNIINCSR